jgi:cytochrome P450
VGEAVQQRVGDAAGFLAEEQNAMRLRVEAGELNAAAQRAGKISGDYVLLTLMFASVLFFGGITGTFTAKRVRALEPLIAEVFENLWAAGRSEDFGGSMEWMAAVANQLPMTIVCRLIASGSYISTRKPFSPWSITSRTGAVSDATITQPLDSASKHDHDSTKGTVRYIWTEETCRSDR